MPDLFTWTAAIVLVIGFCSGVLAGMFGIGGAVITTPTIRALGASPIHAVGSTVPAILPGAISGAYRYSRSGLVDWRVGLTCGAAGSVLAVVGAKAADLVDAHYLMVLTAAVLLSSGISTYRSARAEVPVAAATADLGPEPIDPFDGPAVAPRLPVVRLIGVGAAAGALAGVLGVGGGIVMIPAFTRVLQLPMKLAVGSSLVAVSIFSVPALVTHAYLGHIDWSFALPMVIGIIPGAQVGAHLTMGSSDVRIRRLFGIFVTILAVIYGTTELLALRT